MSKKSREKTPELEEIAAQLGSMNTQEEDTITIPVVEIFRQLKKYFLPWVLVAVILAGLVFWRFYGSVQQQGKPADCNGGIHF